MKEYCLLENIIIERPLLFLCGPYYKKTDGKDRRKILSSFILSESKNNCLPLIIDHFLTEDNIKDPSVSIKLMEEICAAVSYRTYIFLDTLSSAAELGIFSSSAYMNKIFVFIPKQKDVYKYNVGYFVKKVALKIDENRTTVLEYRPRVTRSALSTDFVSEKYSFVDNKVPTNIQELIRDDRELSSKDKQTLKVDRGTGRPQTPYHITFCIDENTLIINTSIRLLFYVTLAIASEEYADFFNKRDDDFTKLEVDVITY